MTRATRQRSGIPLRDGQVHRYSFRNILLITHQRPDATYVPGFRTWQKLGRYVKRGEKGIKILAPIVRKNKQVATDGVDEPTIAYFITTHVFDCAEILSRSPAHS